MYYFLVQADFKTAKRRNIVANFNVSSIPHVPFSADKLSEPFYQVPVVVFRVLVKLIAVSQT